MKLEYTCNISIENITIVEKLIDSKEHIDPAKFVIELNDNIPAFKDDDEKQLEGNDNPFSTSDERRCGVAFACISNNTLFDPDDSDKRPNIHSKPSGFPKSKEDNTVNNKLIFQRCHLIGYNLYKKRNDKGEENANFKKIFAGTRFMNNEMLYFENMIVKYVDGEKNKNNCVIYRVTPYFKGNNQIVYGVQMEAKFINEKNEEDKKLSFNKFVYNIQPGIIFDYKTGKISSKESIDLLKKMLETKRKYVINEKNKKFHIEGCARVCLKNHSRHLYAPICVIFAPNSVDVAHYASFIWYKSPTNCDAHLTESIFQTRPRACLKNQCV